MTLFFTVIGASAGDLHSLAGCGWLVAQLTVMVSVHWVVLTGVGAVMLRLPRQALLIGSNACIGGRRLQQVRECWRVCVGRAQRHTCAGACVRVCCYGVRALGSVCMRCSIILADCCFCSRHRQRMCGSSIKQVGCLDLDKHRTRTSSEDACRTQRGRPLTPHSTSVIR